MGINRLARPIRVHKIPGLIYRRASDSSISLQIGYVPSLGPSVRNAVMESFFYFLFFAWLRHV